VYIDCACLPSLMCCASHFCTRPRGGRIFHAVTQRFGSQQLRSPPRHCTATSRRLHTRVRPHARQSLPTHASVVARCRRRRHDPPSHRHFGPHHSPLPPRPPSHPPRRRIHGESAFPSKVRVTHAIVRTMRVPASRLAPAGGPVPRSRKWIFLRLTSSSRASVSVSWRTHWQMISSHTAAYSATARMTIVHRW
jgi:hypothetical protein